MKIDIDHLFSGQDELIHCLHIIGQKGEKVGYETYIVGGIVRDAFMGKAITDLDVVVIGDALTFAENLAKGLKAGPVVKFEQFGTAMIPYKPFRIEVVTARKEVYQQDSRKPDVTFTDLTEDLRRRDFTINAMAFGLNSDNFGELADPFNGREDLRKGIIRTPADPDITFSDDPLRMMRAVRFAGRLHFDIDPVTFAAISNNRERIAIVSAERISDELNQIILTDKPSEGFKYLDSSGLLELILPEVHALKGIESYKGQKHKDNFYHTLEVLDNIALKSDNLWLRWAALLHDIAKPVTKKFEEGQGWTFHHHEYAGSRMIPAIFKRLKLPLDERMRYVRKLVFLHLRPIILSQEQVTDSAVRRLLFEAGDDTDDLMMLCEADITSKNEARVRQYLRNFELVREKMKSIEEKDHIRNFQPPVSGDVICEAFGISPSKEVGIIKNTIKNAILDGEIPNEYGPAWDLMVKKGKELGLKLVSKL